MKSLTLSVREDVLQHTRVQAAKAGKSMSQFVSDMLERHYNQDDVISESETRRRLERLQHVFDGPKWDVSVNGRMPSADERNARR